MIKRNNKKGFTIVELVIVIAVIAILAAVLIPTFAGIIRKANESKDTQLVKNLNTFLAADTDGCATMSEALEVAAEAGYNLDKINASASGNEILWDSVNNVFVYLKDGEVTRIPEDKSDKAVADYQYWQIVTEVPEDAKYSLYASDKFTATTVEVGVGFDAGNVTTIESLTYKNAGEADVFIRTNGQCDLTIDAPNSNVDFYGSADEVNVTAVKGESLHVYGAIAKLSVTKGHVEVENTGMVFEVAAMEAAANITNNGYIAKVAEGVTGVAKNDTLEIADLAQLESFRDAVNNGNSFDGLTVTLTADITLNDGWTPIGEGSRKTTPTGSNAGHYHGNFTGTAFNGTFNGNNKTISNLNNKGYIPAVGKVSEGQYVYGFFGIVASNAVLKDVTFANVDIDTTRYADADGDSVGALVGLVAKEVTVSNIKVSGSIKGRDSVGGVIGAVKNQVDGEGTRYVTVENCENNASVTATHEKAAGIIGNLGVRGYVCKVNNNTNNGRIESLGVAGGVAGILLYDGNAFKAIDETNCSEAKNNKNTGNLYITEASLTPSGVQHGFGLIGGAATGTVPKTCNTITGNTNSGKFYAGSEDITTSIREFSATATVGKDAADLAVVREANNANQ